jgi:hypothetical protein
MKKSSMFFFALFWFLFPLYTMAMESPYGVWINLQRWSLYLHEGEEIETGEPYSEQYTVGGEREYAGQLSCWYAKPGTYTAQELAAELQRNCWQYYYRIVLKQRDL